MIKIWDSQSGAEVLSWEAHTDAVAYVAFNPEGTRIVSCGGGDDRHVKVWDSLTGQLVQLMPVVHTQAITCVAFSTDGSRIASGSVDRTIRIYDATANVPAVLHTLQSHRGGITSVAFSPDGTHFLSADDKADEVDMGLLNSSKYADLCLETIPQLFLQFANTILTNTISTSYILSNISSVYNGINNLYGLFYWAIWKPWRLGVPVRNLQDLLQKIKNIPQSTSDLNNYSYRYDVANEVVIWKSWRDTLTGIFSYCCCCFWKPSAARVATEDFELARQESHARLLLEKKALEDENRELKKRNLDLEANIPAAP